MLRFQFLELCLFEALSRSLEVRIFLTEINTLSLGLGTISARIVLLARFYLRCLYLFNFNPGSPGPCDLGTEVAAYYRILPNSFEGSRQNLMLVQILNNCKMNYTFCSCKRPTSCFTYYTRTFKKIYIKSLKCRVSEVRWTKL